MGGLKKQLPQKRPLEDSGHVACPVLHVLSEMSDVGRVGGV